MDQHVHWKNCSPSGESGVDIESGAIDGSGVEEQEKRAGAYNDQAGFRLPRGGQVVPRGGQRPFLRSFMDLHVHRKNCSPSGESGIEIESGAIDGSGVQNGAIDKAGSVICSAMDLHVHWKNCKFSSTSLT